MPLLNRASPHPVGQPEASSCSCCSLCCLLTLLGGNCNYPMSLGAAGTKGREVCSGLDPVRGIPAQLQDHPGCEQQQPHLYS